MQTRLKFLGIVILAIFVLSCFLTFNSVVCQTNSADSKLLVASDAVDNAFNDVSTAEKAGANITSFLNQLNEAADLLAQAEMDYRNGDLGSSASNAESAFSIAQKVSSEAQIAESTALANGQNAFWSAIVFSVVGSVVFVLMLLFFWRRFRNNYFKNLSKAKPGLAQQ